MANRWAGFSVVGDVVTMVDCEIPDGENEPIVIIADDTWKLQAGDRPSAYHVMYRRCSNYLKENGITKALVKASALTMGSTKLAHLTSAELRGVIISAAAAQCDVRAIPKALISRTYGDRKVDEYLQDDDFWDENTTGKALRKNSREAVMIVIAVRSGK